MDRNQCMEGKWALSCEAHPSDLDSRLYSAVISFVSRREIGFRSPDKGSPPYTWTRLVSVLTHLFVWMIWGSRMVCEGKQLHTKDRIIKADGAMGAFLALIRRPENT
ncbi:hypothetical protein OS493_019785 [Desmophyllum pertusum]|uniref:Uncharacterized protein n=1 Tax=Desmophyllum pertusum TaxID=174260 RepID=A0A9W9YZP7_9CNID|nr:hypothetical protein OS493_019785 [Desmophyllum pertusum]